MLFGGYENKCWQSNEITCCYSHSQANLAELIFLVVTLLVTIFS